MASPLALVEIENNEGDHDQQRDQADDLTVYIESFVNYTHRIHPESTKYHHNFTILKKTVLKLYPLM